jgi:predicted GTPase
MHDDLGDWVAGIERAARESLVLVLDDVAPADLGLDHDMVREYGLTSLNKVLFLTDVCERTRVSVSHFTEHDVAAMRTLRDVVTALARHANLAGKGTTP